MELKGPHGPHPSFPLGVSLTSLSRQTSRETVGGGRRRWSVAGHISCRAGGGVGVHSEAGQCPWFSHTGIAFLKVKSSSGL